MSVEIRVPQLPESVADATLVAWRKDVGQSVSRDENLADLETDKVVLEVPAPVSGILRELKVVSGTTVKSGELLAVIEEGASAAAQPAAPVVAAAPAPKTGPAARRVIAENKLPADALAAAAQPAPAPAAPAAAASGPRGGRVEQRVPMTRLRSRIAERLVQAQATQALLTTFNEVDLGAVQELRARYKEAFEKKHGVKLGFMSFFVKATVEALKRFPVVNASVEKQDIVYHEYFDVGVAVSTERGLIVPVLRDVDAMSFAAVEQGIADFALRARNGTITLEDLSGGTFSITNGGTFGSLLSTPIVNAPQSAILGMHKIQERPMAVKGAVVVRPMMYLALSYDHRIIDGREAVQFLVTIKEGLEDPGRLLIGV